MVRFNTTLLNTMFGSGTSASSEKSSSGSSQTATIITGIALSDSVDGEVLIQIGDPIEDIRDEADDIFVLVEDEDTVDSIDDDILAEEPGEDDEEYDEEDFIETPTVYIGDDEEASEGDEIPTDDELEGSE